MFSVIDIANYFLLKSTDDDFSEPMTQLKLQKLIYYAQGYSLAAFEEPLFEEEIVAWDHGPVVADLWYALKGCDVCPLLPPNDLEMSEFDPELATFLDDIYELYGQYSAWKLRNMTHQEPPWKNTPRSHVISHELLCNYFSQYVE